MSKIRKLILFIKNDSEMHYFELINVKQTQNFPLKSYRARKFIDQNLFYIIKYHIRIGKNLD